MRLDAFFSSAPLVLASAVLLRVALLAYGHFQDQFSPLKYTDIDYFVFTDAARYVSHGGSPYQRDTYRYTPLLAWLLVPSTFGRWWFLFGKALFALSDIFAGLLILKILRSSYSMTTQRALRFASLWLLNPMVAQISTRGSSEGLLGVMVMLLLWAALDRYYVLAGCFLGIAVHFKIYPFIYAVSVIIWMDDVATASLRSTFMQSHGKISALSSFINRGRVTVTVASFLTFSSLNVFMFSIYGRAFLDHTYLYHLIRTDHRHNFSPYNLLLYLNSSPAYASDSHPEALAFIPQLLLSAIIVPLVLAKKDLPSCMLVQTLAFVTFNKVCTSQYFLWYLIFLPFYLPISSFLWNTRLGLVALAVWVLGQALWLQQGYQLEFLGRSTFTPGLWFAGSAFFLVNVWILMVIISDVRQFQKTSRVEKTK